MTNLTVEDLQALLALQVVDSQLDRLKATLAALDTGAATAASYATGKAEFDKLKSTAIKTQTEQHDAEMRLQAIETKTTQVNKQLYESGAVSARDLKNLQMELDMLARQKGDAEEKVLIAMEAAAEADAFAKAKEAELTDLADVYRGLRSRYKTRSAELTAEIAAVTAQRATVAAPVPAPLLARYEQIRTRKGGVGAASLSPDDTCGACHIKLNAGLVDAIRAAGEPQLCEYCGRIMVPPISAAA